MCAATSSDVASSPPNRAAPPPPSGSSKSPELDCRINFAKVGVVGDFKKFPPAASGSIASAAGFSGSAFLAGALTCQYMEGRVSRRAKGLLSSSSAVCAFTLKVSSPARCSLRLRSLIAMIPELTEVAGIWDVSIALRVSTALSSSSPSNPSNLLSSVSSFFSSAASRSSANSALRIAFEPTTTLSWRFLSTIFAISCSL
mmetsp:Transcript_20637/g.52387  ORF Transcript_20637/g.52387 Transcript_20637/m.52387 type:complete len:200 (+) Transcript_20637:466-1065(+)